MKEVAAVVSATHRAHFVTFMGALLKIWPATARRLGIVPVAAG